MSSGTLHLYIRWSSSTTSHLTIRPNVLPRPWPVYCYSRPLICVSFASQLCTALSSFQSLFCILLLRDRLLLHGSGLLDCLISQLLLGCVPLAFVKSCIFEYSPQILLLLYNVNRIGGRLYDLGFCYAEVRQRVLPNVIFFFPNGDDWDDICNPFHPFNLQNVTSSSLR